MVGKQYYEPNSGQMGAHMSDHFERVKTDILKRTLTNGGPTPLDLLEALEATNEDNDEDHKVIIQTLSDHMSAEQKQAAKIAEELVTWRTRQAEECLYRHMGSDARGAEREEPLAAREEPLAAPPSAEVADLMTAWKRLKWFIVVVVAAFVVMLADQLGNLIFGGPT